MQKSLDLSAHEEKQLGMEPKEMAFKANNLFFYVPLTQNNKLIEVSELITSRQT